MRVLHITEVLEAAGIESFIMNVYRNIDRKKVQFDFLVMRDQTEFYDEEIAKLGGRKYTISIPVSNTLLRIQLESLQLYRFLKKHKYDVIHIHTTTPLRAPYLLAAKMANVKTRIYHSHSAEVRGKSKIKLFIYNYYQKKISKWATDWFACSEVAAEWMYEKRLIDRGKVNVVYNGIDTKRFSYNLSARAKIRKQMNLEDAFVITHTGRFLPQKKSYAYNRCF